MPCDPVQQALQQITSAIAVLKREIATGVLLAIGGPQHVDLTLSAALEGDGIQIAPRIGLDIQRCPAQRWPIALQRCQARILHAAIRLALAARRDACRDETLHQVAVRRTNIRFVDIDANRLQTTRQLAQGAIFTTVEPHHRAMVEVFQCQRSQLGAGLKAHQCLSQYLLFDGQESDDFLGCTFDTYGAFVGANPEADHHPLGRVPPMTGQHEAMKFNRSVAGLFGCGLWHCITFTLNIRMPGRMRARRVCILIR